MSRKRGGRGNKRGGGRGGFAESRRLTSEQSAFQRGRALQNSTNGNAFTLADEARQTGRRADSLWSQSSVLRTRPVAFVSAGPSQPLKLLEDLLDLENPEAEAAGVAEVSPVKSPAPFEVQDHPPQSSQAPRHEEDAIEPIQYPYPLEETTASTPDGPLAFFFDLGQPNRDGIAEGKRYEGLPKPPVDDESSSEEVILFKGRSAANSSNIASGAAPSNEITMNQLQAEIEVVESNIRIDHDLQHQDYIALSDDREFTTQRHRRRKNMPRRAHGTKRVTSEDEMLADYIANMKENGDDDGFLEAVTANARDLGGTESDSNSESDFAGIAKARNEHVSMGLTDRQRTYSSGSELDDDTLRQLIEGHVEGFADGDMGTSDSDSDSDSSDLARQYRVSSKGEGNDMSFTDLDLMDWERPSLRPRKGKAARARIEFNADDDDLDEVMLAAWDNDRLKKSERKKQREQLRALGLLGTNLTPSDLTIKYPSGMSLQEVARELKIFMQSEDQQISLPPMDKHARKMVHEIANKFNIKSKSTGKASSRKPTLYKTKRTTKFSDANVEQVVSRMERRYFPRLDKRGKKAKGQVRGGGGYADASYRDGEVVGATAPELGAENRGRAMLEKMGWSTGTALGATDNKGILQPVMQTMKRTRTGLG